jgi:prepilin-type N-terminal cleavage/methylation domain-containing protein
MTTIKFYNKRGFTLVEMLVALGMFALISVAVGDIVIRSLRSNDVIWEQLKTQNDGRAVLEQFVDDVRRAEPSSIGGYPIADASSSTFTFFANIDSDIGRERVRFFLDGTDVKKGVIEPSGDPLGYDGAENIVTVATDAVNIAKGVPLFEYYDETYPVTSTPLIVPENLTDIRLVRVQLELEKDPNETPVPLHVETIASVRNLKSN